MVKSATRACQILRLVGLNKSGLRHAKIAKALKIPSGSLSGLLASLLSERFLSFDPVTQLYSIGSEIFSIAGNFFEDDALAEISRPIIQKLVDETNESVSISVKIGQHIMAICKADSPMRVIHKFQIGLHMPIYATAGGKAMLAHLGQEEIDEYLSSVELSALTPKTIKDAGILRRQLTEVKASGVAYNLEESDEQVFAMSAPVFGLHGKVVAAMSVSLVFHHSSDAQLEIIAKALKKYASTLSRKLGFVDKDKKL